MRRSSLSFLIVSALGSMVHFAPARAETPASADAAPQELEYFTVDVGPLVAKFNKSQIVSNPPIIKASFYQKDTSPHLVVPAGVEAYLLSSENPSDAYAGYRIVGTKPRGKPVDGRLFLLRRHPDQPSETVLAQFDFAVDARPAAAATRQDFLRAKGREAQRLWSEEFAGAALFRHLAMTSLKAVGETVRYTGPNWPLRRNDGVDDTIQLMSGGRAVSENLQLDAELRDPDGRRDKTIELSEVAGIQVRAIDWTSLLKGQPTELDPLAKRVPHDQYAAFIPSFDALAQAVDRGGELSKPILQWFEPQSRRTDVLDFYQRQLGLPLNALTRQIGGALIDEVALTGSDPYFRTGTDVAVLMRSGQPELLHQSILAQVMAQTALHRDVKQVQHKIGDHVLNQWSTDNRKLCSIVGLVDDTVIVSNSLHQVLRILRCGDGQSEAMADLDEYRFFRQRYPRNSVNESALVVVTDAAIRRWCGPQWRISASRRTRARATIADVTAMHADDIVRGTLAGTTTVRAAAGMPDAGSLMLNADGVYSKTYGSLDFQTPIAEMDLKQATAGEVEAYSRWRDQYERRWRRVFDPIALQLSFSEDSIHADLSVIPLVLQTDYRFFTQLVGNVHLKPSAGDPHPESLARMTIAVDTNSSLFAIAQAFLLNGQTTVDLTSWIDDSITLYLDHDQEWMKRLDQADPWRLNSTDLARDAPAGIFIPSRDNLRMTAFVVAIRGVLERFSPNVIRWENVKHGEFDYVMGTVFQGTPLGNAEDMPRVYYVTTPKGLTLSPNRGVIERAIDRQMGGKDSAIAETARSESGADPDANAGPQLVLQGTAEAADVMTRMNYRSGLYRMNRIAWSNIPILNFFHARYPDRDPIEVYRKLFGETIVEPSGGTYEWNEDRGTYVSTLHGYHLEPNAGPTMASVLAESDEVKTTLSFQDGGLRATLDVQQK